MSIITGIASRGREYHAFVKDGDEKPLCMSIRGTPHIYFNEDKEPTCANCKRLTVIIDNEVTERSLVKKIVAGGKKKKVKASSARTRKASKKTIRTKPKSTRSRSSSRRRPVKTSKMSRRISKR